MSDSDSQEKTPRSSTTKRGTPTKRWLVFAVLVAIIGILMFAIREHGDAGRGNLANEADGGSLAEGTQASLATTRTALAATENLDISEAETAWSQLFEESPNDPSVALNRAINRVLRVDQLSSTARNASLGKDENHAARAQLPDAITGGRTAIDEFAKASHDDVSSLWLRSRIDLLQASLLPGPLTKSLRRSVYSRLSDAINGKIGQNAKSMILGGQLIEVVEQMEDPIDGLPKNVLESASRTLAVLSNHHRDNLFFALRAARANIAAKHKQAVEFVQRADELSRAIEPSIRQDTKPIGVTPTELVAQIVAAIESKKWDEAESRMLLWFNVLNKTEIVKTDRRRASPHPLDRLSFDSLRQLSASEAESNPIDQSEHELVIKTSVIDGANAQVVLSIDFDLDLVPDLVGIDDTGRLTLWKNDGKANFSRDGDLDLGITVAGAIVADLFVVDSSHPERLKTEAKQSTDAKPDFSVAVRHNTFATLIAFGDEGVRLVQVDGRTSTRPDARLKIVDGETGFDDVRGVTAALAGDLEADGDLDLVLATKSDGVRLFVNRGNRTFFEIGGDPSFGREDPVSALALADLDRDLDLDIVTTHSRSGRVGLLENLLHLQFRGRVLNEIEPIEDASSIAVQDFDGNVSWDLIVGGTKQTAVVFSQTADAGAWTVDRTVVSDQPSPQMIVADLDNDSWMEAIGVTPEDVRVTRIGPWGFGPTEILKALSGTTSLIAADFDQNGTVDLSGVNDLVTNLYFNQSNEKGHYVDVRFRGIDDNASGRVNHYAIGSVLECRFGPHYRAQIVTSPSTHFGTGGFDQANSLRVIFPNGLTQTVRELSGDSLVEEEQTLKGSCPYLYAWDGEKFVFQTDCLWAAPLGLQVARGVVAQDRPWEYLKLDGATIQPKSDRYEFRMTEELWEVAYFDKIALTVVDHPAEVEVWTNEKVGPGSIATPTIFALGSKDLRSVDSASDTRGRDVTKKLLAADRDFVQGFDRRLRQGLCEPHWIDLTFENAIPETIEQDAKVYLVLTGWILPTDTSLNIQIDQNPDLGPLEFPSVWVPSTADTQWTNVIPFMGFPGGKTKTIVVDVSDVMNRDDLRFRIRTSAQIYWDRAAVAVQQSPAEFETQEVELLSAEVAFHGFSEKHREDDTQPETYNYHNASQSSRWPPLRGGFTRFGDCLSLVREWDDAMVVIGSGDEIRMSFSLPQKPLPKGWKRDFILHSVGWDKDADLNTLAGQSTEPLPFREMTQYPPLLGDPRSREREQINRPHLQRFQSFRSFWYRSTSDPR